MKAELRRSMHWIFLSSRLGAVWIWRWCPWCCGGASWGLGGRLQRLSVAVALQYRTLQDAVLGFIRLGHNTVRAGGGGRSNLPYLRRTRRKEKKHKKITRRGHRTHRHRHAVTEVHGSAILATGYAVRGSAACPLGSRQSTPPAPCLACARVPRACPRGARGRGASSLRTTVD
jgi:hypothetical protein